MQWKSLQLCNCTVVKWERFCFCCYRMPIQCCTIITANFVCEVSQFLFLIQATSLFWHAKTATWTNLTLNTYRKNQYDLNDMTSITTLSSQLFLTSFAWVFLSRLNKAREYRSGVLDWKANANYTLLWLRYFLIIFCTTVHKCWFQIRWCSTPYEEQYAITYWFCMLVSHNP